MADQAFYNVQYESRFTSELVSSPKFVKDELVEMYLELQRDPKHGVAHRVIRSEERPGAYHMLFDQILAWITYTVEDKPKRMVKVYRLVNARDLI